eukprot:TRINITY_DN3891_c0_g3_i1.p3 TRINITY_DN3891_c0_g3~~TRINITY_DN3891_c0_g3_i1.p3  ORF type:complete len:100 (+),score=6.92 TRINITY_DN3891_c0_g3_i1:1294-1593(+)
MSADSVGKTAAESFPAATLVPKSALRRVKRTAKFRSSKCYPAGIPRWCPVLQAPTSLFARPRARENSNIVNTFAPRHAEKSVKHLAKRARRRLKPKMPV